MVMEVTTRFVEKGNGKCEGVVMVNRQAGETVWFLKGLNLQRWVLHHLFNACLQLMTQTSLCKFLCSCRVFISSKSGRRACLKL